MSYNLQIPIVSSQTGSLSDGAMFGKSGSMQEIYFRGYCVEIVYEKGTRKSIREVGL